MKNIRPPSDFIDPWGLLDKIVGRDGGDTCQREGMFWTILGMMNNELRNKWLRLAARDWRHYDVVMKKLHVAPGVFVRHIRPLSDVNSWDRMSRDQFQAMIQATGYWSRTELKKIAKGHLIRGFLFTNNTRRNGVTRETHGKIVSGELRNYDWKLPDITGPDIVGAFIRANNKKLWWPILLICDLELLVSAILWRYFPKHNIAMNHTLIQIVAYDRLSTPLSWLAMKIMPFDRLFNLIGEHLTDFHPTDDMFFFKEMFQDALVSINGRKKR